MSGEKPARGLPMPTPHHTAPGFSDFYRWRKCQTDSRSAKSTRRIETRRNNISTHFPHEDVYFFSSPYCADKLCHLLSVCLASEKDVLYSEGKVYKKAPELVASPQSTALHSTGNTSVKNSVTRTKLTTTAHVE